MKPAPMIDESSTDDEGSEHKRCSCFGHDDPAFKGKGQLRGKVESHDYDQHRCTDIACLLIFIAALVFTGYICVYSYEKGDMRRLYHGYDFLGSLCGLGPEETNTNQTDLTNKPVLFWCEEREGVLDTAHPICRETCPTSRDTSYPCYDRTLYGQQVYNVDPNLGGEGSFMKTNTYLYKDQTDYPSKALFGIYCYPTDNELAKQLMEYIKGNPAMKAVIEAMSIKNAWPLLVIAAVLSIVLGFAFLKLLEYLARCLVYTSLGVLCLCPLLIGGYLCYVASGYAGEEGVDNLPSTGDNVWDWFIGVSCIILGIVFIVLSLCACTAVDTAIRVIQATSEALMDMPSLLFEPVITQVIRLLILTVMMLGFLQLLSVGQMSSMSLEEYSVMSGGGMSGVLRTFQYEQDDLYYILYYIFMIFWTMCLGTALAQFALAYAVQKWYFTPYEPGGKPDQQVCPIFRGYCVGLRYHLGSVAFGSFIIAVLMFIKTILGFIARQAKAEGNQAVQVAANCLMCCVNCFQRCMEFLNKNAYMDIALNSTSFCFAAKNAFTIIIKNFPEIAILNGACWVFHVAGIGAIAGSCTVLVFLCTQHLEWFNNPESGYYVADPLVILIFTALLSGLVAHAFMTVFDMVADTILYCKATELIRRYNGEYPDNVQFAPNELDELVERKRKQLNDEMDSGDEESS